ncbi:hypothetical protein [Pedobacter deserti]|nr:hypothetical protein [Pedobacter sp. SYSU D00382]
MASKSSAGTAKEYRLVAAQYLPGSYMDAMRPNPGNIRVVPG